MFRFIEKPPEQEPTNEGRGSISFEEVLRLSNVSSPTETVGRIPKGFPPSTRLIPGGIATPGYPYESSRELAEQELYEEFRGFIRRELL